DLCGRPRRGATTGRGTRGSRQRSCSCSSTSPTWSCAASPATAPASASSPPRSACSAPPTSPSSTTACRSGAASIRRSSPATAATPASRATTFQPVEGGGEQRSGETLLVEAYVVLWVILMGWLFFLWRKQNGLHARLDDLERVIDKAADAKESKPKAG